MTGKIIEISTAEGTEVKAGDIVVTGGDEDGIPR